MESLLTLNFFALSLPAALLGAGLCGGLMALPLWLARQGRCSDAAPPA